MKSLAELGIEYLDQKNARLSDTLIRLKGDMEELFQRKLFASFGDKANMEAFEKLSSFVPARIIRRQKANRWELEAILFGQSGLLPEIPVDSYSADLLYRYVMFRSKYNLESMFGTSWRFMRMRPSNFPTIRISQLAVLLNNTQNLYAKCAGEADIEELKKIFDVSASEYWTDHFRFGVSSGPHPKPVGEEMTTTILINTVATLRYFVGTRLNDTNLKVNALEMLQTLPPLPRVSWKLISDKEPANALESLGILAQASSDISTS